MITLSSKRDNFIFQINDNPAMAFSVPSFIGKWLLHRKHLIVELLLFISLQAIGQNEYLFFKYYEPFRPDSTGKFYLAVDNANFFKNNEYLKEIAKGYTLTGAWLRPKAVLLS